jgi:carbohydrate-selective porin OprB
MVLITNAASAQPAASTSQSATASAPGPSDFGDYLTGDGWGQRQRLKQIGITAGASFLGEVFENIQGGMGTAHRVGATTVDGNLTIDAEKLAGWQGAQFYADLEDHAFGNPSTALVLTLRIQVNF